MGGGVFKSKIKNKGFTLAELLAVIAILAIIALIIFPTVNKTIKNSKEKAYQQQIESILESAENWTLENMSSLSDTNDNYVTIEELTQSGYLETKQVINPITDEEMNGCVVIRYDESYHQYAYSYNETSCEELNTLPLITLNGESTITIGLGDTYTELGATATYQDTDISSSIQITNNIDNNKVGTYQVRYNVTYNGTKAKEVVRTVKVIDASPIITLKGESTVTIGLNKTYTDAGATAKTYEGTDITSSIVVTSDVDTTKTGTYTVRYNVTYNGKSAKEVTRTVNVVDKSPSIVLDKSETSDLVQSVIINVTATPYTGNTISTLVYKLNNGSEQTVTNNTIKINTTGSHTIEVIATDNEGNTGTITSGTYNIDADKPTIALEVSGTPFNSEGWSKTDVTLNVTTNDTGGSSVSTYKYCTGNNCTPNITGTSNTITINTESSTNYVCAISIDGVGNESEKTCVGPYKIDKTISEPTIASTASANSNGWYKANIGINLTTSSDTSGISTIKYCKTSTNTTCTPDTTITGTSGSETIDTESEMNYICALNIDNAGNESTTKCSEPYKLDKTSPTLTVPADVTITPSQVASYDLLNGASATDGLSDIDGSITTSGDLSAVVGEYTITYTVTDIAGNTVSKKRKITVTHPSVLEVMSKSNEVAALDLDQNLRYVGPDPDNYVTFNKELWRIIGVFDGQAKIIRNDYFSTSMWWDNKANCYDINVEGYIFEQCDSFNDWATSSLQLALNNTTDGYITMIKKNDITSYNYIDLEHVWNIGAVGVDYRMWTRENMYNLERGNTPAKTEGSLTTWTGAIGLMYPSDYGYAASGDKIICDTSMFEWNKTTNETTFNECAEKSWLYDSNYSIYTLTTKSDSTSNVLAVLDSGELYLSTTYNKDFETNPTNTKTVPTLYLKPNVKIIGGKGTDQEPYQLGV